MRKLNQDFANQQPLERGFPLDGIAAEALERSLEMPESVVMFPTPVVGFAELALDDRQLSRIHLVAKGVPAGIDRLLIVMQRFGVGGEAIRLGARLEKIFLGTLPDLGASEVIGQRAAQLVQVVREQQFQRFGNLLVHLAPARAQDAVISDLLDDGMPEDIFKLRVLRMFANESLFQKIGQVFVQLKASFRDRAQDLVEKSLADDGSDRQDEFHVFGQPVDPGGDQVLDGGGNADGLDVRGQTPFFNARSRTSALVSSRVRTTSSMKSGLPSALARMVSRSRAIRGAPENKTSKS